MSMFERLPIKQWVNLPFSDYPHNTKPILNKKNNETTYELKGRPLFFLLTSSNKTNNMINKKTTTLTCTGQPLLCLVVNNFFFFFEKLLGEVFRLIPTIVLVHLFSEDPKCNNQCFVGHFS